VNNELKITIIACAVIFAAVGFMATETMSSDKIIKPQINNISQPTEIIDKTIEEKLDISNTTEIQINGEIKVEKTTTRLSIPENNLHPWGIIKGKVTNPAPGHPVIIQFFKSLEDGPVHIAQIDLNEDNSYEYKFRLFSIDDGITTPFFKGDYIIKIFKTVTTS
jgi:post-segregation antitoxin (ccd killing protein)